MENRNFIVELSTDQLRKIKDALMKNLAECKTMAGRMKLRHQISKIDEELLRLRA